MGECRCNVIFLISAVTGDEWSALLIVFFFLKFLSERSSPAFFYVFPLTLKIPLSTISSITAFIIIIIIIMTRNYDTFYNKH
jgi:hypothetical protein